MLKKIFLTMVLCSFISSTFAESGLTPKRVEQWFASQQALAQWGEAHHEKIAGYEDQPDSFQDLTSITANDILKPLKSSGLYESAASVVKQHGFISLEEWAETTMLITKTAAVIELENRPEALDVSQLEALKNDPQLSGEQKQLLDQAIEKNLTIIKLLFDSVTTKDKDVVRPFLERISKLAEEP